MSSARRPSKTRGNLWPSNPYCGFADDRYRFWALSIQNICKVLIYLGIAAIAGYFGVPVLLPSILGVLR